jgi:anhydro-N-acetylmuramic acid kinase
MQPILAIGLMSGTSLDGIDAALIETDGLDQVRPIAFTTEEYTPEEREVISRAMRVAWDIASPDPDAPAIREAESLLTRRHAEIVARLRREAGSAGERVEVIGFHGQTIAHRPERGWTWQIGDAAWLSEATGLPVVADLRSADVAAGGQGAPLLPVYHAALTAGLARPVGILNLGGVGNLTWIGADGAMIAFDTGPANGLVNRWIERCTGGAYDADGAYAAAGEVDRAVLDAMLDHGWFAEPPPKSLDRYSFTEDAVSHLSRDDGAATLTRFTAETLALALRHVPEMPARLIVAGGGRRNPTLMAMIADACGVTPEPIEAVGWNGDATEAEGFAYMAVRSLRGLPISFPGTTGVSRPLTGGVLHRARPVKEAVS